MAPAGSTGSATKGEQIAQAAETVARLGMGSGELAKALVKKRKPARIPPREFEYAISVYRDLAAARGAGMSGPNAITFADLSGWCQVFGIQLLPWEVDAIRFLDLAYLRLWYDRHSTP